MSRGEGKQLQDSIVWFQDKKVVYEFLRAVDQIAYRLPKKVTMLEIGTGTGVVGLAVAKHLQEVCGTEVSLTLSDRNISGMVSDDSVSVVLAENSELPFGSGKFDLVVSRSVTHYEKDQASEAVVLREVNRTLGSGGWYINQSLYLPNHAEIELHQELNSCVRKRLNLKTYSELIDIHRKGFSDVQVLVDRVDFPLTVDREAFLKRYNLLESVGDGLRDAIKERRPVDVPSFWVHGSDFGWSVDYAILACSK